jgi:pimeloyl-ACP methyl ester carboxylesterase
VSGTPTAERRQVRYGMFDVPLLWGGRGRPLLFLHGAWGLLGGWGPHSHLARLAEHHLVLAPSHPGFDGATGLEHLDDVLDLTLYYLDFIDELMLDSPYLVGHGFGAMIAAEMAALAPQRIAKVVLVAPYGLWLEGAPIADVFAMTADELQRALWYHPESATALDESPEAQLQRVQNLAAAAKFLWPIPDKGLRKRLHRLLAPTLLVWGDRDDETPLSAGRLMEQLIPDAGLVVFEGAGHYAYLEQSPRFGRIVRTFFQGSAA